MTGTVFQWQSAGFSVIIKEYNSLGEAQKKLDALVRQLAKAFEAQGASKQSALLGAKELAKANGLTAESIQKLTVRQKELEAGSKQIEALVRKQVQIQAEAVRNNQAQEKAVQSLGFALKGNVDSFNRLNTAFKNNAVEAKNAVEAYEKLRGSGASLTQTQKALESQLGVTASQFQVLNRELNQSRGDITQAQQGIVAFGLAVSAGIGTAFANGAKQYADFERVIQQIGVISESTATPALEQLEATIKQLALSTTKTPQEIAEVTKELVKAGFSAEEATLALNGIVKGSEATGESLLTVGDVIAKTIRQFNLTAGDSTKIADLLTKTANATNTDIRGLGESLKFVGVAANQSNQTVESTLTLLGLLGDSGLQAGQGGRNAAQALTRLNIASAELPPELETVVKGSAKMRTAFKLLQTDLRDSDNQLKQLPDVIKILKTQLEGFDAGERAVLLKALFGDEGGRAIGAAINRSVEDINNLENALKNASGTVDKQSKVLTEGLPGAFALFESSTQLLSQQLGEFLAPALEAVLRSATALINGFLQLPAPVQAIVFGTTALVGALAAASAAIAAFNLAASAGVLSSGLLAVKIVASTISLTAQTASLVTAAIAAGNYSAANAVLATSIGTVNAALTPMIAAFIAALPAIIAVGLAIGVVVAALQYLDTQDQIDAMDALANSTTNSINEFGAIAGKIRGFNQAIKENGKLTAEQTKQAKGYIGIAQQKIKSLDQEIAALKAIKTNDKERQASIDAQIGAIEQQKQTLTNMVGALEKNIATSKTKEDQERRANDATLAGTEASKRKTQALKDEAEALKNAAEAEKIRAKNAFDDRERNISRQQEDQGIQRKESQDSELKAIAEKNAQIEAQIKERYDKEATAREEANQEIINQKKAQFESSVLEPLKTKQEAKRQQQIAAFETEQNEKKAGFERGLREEQARFNQTQNEEKRAFERSIREEEKAFNKQLNAEQKAVDRKVQLATAAPEDRARLLQDFSRQDREAKLREQLEAPLEEKRRAFEEEIQAKKEAFEAEQQAKKADFEDVINAKKSAFEDEQQAKKLAFETEVLAPLKAQQEKELEEKRKAFEQNTLKPIKAQQESEIAALRKQQEAEIGAAKKQAETETNALKKQFAAEERALDRKAEDEKIARLRKFEEEQRTKEKETEDKIAVLKSESDAKQQEAAKIQAEAAQKQLEAAQLNANKPTGNNEVVPGRGAPVGRYTGGSVIAGNPYIVGEKEPEVFVPRVSGTILNQQQIKDNLDRLFSGAENYTIPDTPVIKKPIQSSNLIELIKEVQQLRKTVESKPGTIEIHPQWNPDKPEDNDRNLRLIRSAIRANL